MKDEPSRDLGHSLDLAKAGFESAQARISLLDTKAGMALGLLTLLLPVPVVAVAWLAGLDGDAAQTCRSACAAHASFAWLAGGALLGGGFCAAWAAWRAIDCLQPRGPKNHDGKDTFGADWRPNVLFPMYDDAKEKQTRLAKDHFGKLLGAIPVDVALAEYTHQLEQLGRILGVKLGAMSDCAKWLRRVFLCYGVGVAIGIMILIRGITIAHTEGENSSGARSQSVNSAK